ncbi:MAG: tRNA pseudouridine(55) synthase TruB [Gammaproteobacteria bacterium]
MAGARERRAVGGVLLLDKPVGLSSNAALQSVRMLYRARKAGHAGSLDPLASGMLPIGFGDATKFCGFLLDADKTYRFRCRLGITTTTGDAEGEVLSRTPVVRCERTAIDAVLSHFIGVIEQTPPMYSALKHHGRPLYRLARQGIEIERLPRRVTIHELVLLGVDSDELELQARCSKGTYIRVLAQDIGQALGCGAHVSALRRLSVAPFEAQAMVTLDALRDIATDGLEALDARLLPIDAGLVAWPRITVDGDQARRLQSGLTVLAPTAAHGEVRLYAQDQGFFGIGAIDGDGRLAPRRMMSQS